MERKAGIPTIELMVPFEINDTRHHYTDNEWEFSLSSADPDHGQSLGKLALLSPTINRDKISITTLSTVDISHGATRHQVEDLRCQYRYEGGIDIPWGVNAAVDSDQISMAYWVSLTRPDGSLRYILRQRKDLTYLLAPKTSRYNNWPDHERDTVNGFLRNHKFERLALDGLPFHITVTAKDWSIATGAEGLVDSARRMRVGLKIPKKKPVYLVLENGNSASLAYETRFHGAWDEGWSLTKKGAELVISNMYVNLAGSFEK